MKENKTKYAVLGILSFEPMSGYDIKKFYEQSVANFWSASYGQIYPILKRLAQEGLATRSVRKQEGKPDRHIYTITKKGRQKLQHWLTEPTGRQIGRHEILLKLMFGKQVSIADNIRQIERFRDRQQDELKDVKRLEKKLNKEAGNNPNLPFWRLGFKYGAYINRAYIRWAEEAMVTLRKMEPKSPQKKKR